MVGLPTASILVAEDEIVWQEIYRDLLAEKYAPRIVATFAEAEAALEEQSFDLAIVDPTLKGERGNLDGIKLIKKIATLDEPFPVIVVTGETDKVQAGDPQLKGFIFQVILKGKPFIKSVETILRRKQAQERWLYLSRSPAGVTGYDAYKEILDKLLSLTKADVAHLLVPTERGDELEIVVDTGQDEGRTVLIDNSITGRVFRDRRLEKLGDATKDPEYQSTFGKGPMNSELAVPVRRDNEIVGVLNIESPNYNAFDETHEHLTRTFADLAILMAQSERRQKVLGKLHLIAREVLQLVLEPENVWKQILRRGCELINADVGFLARRLDSRLRIESSTIAGLEGQIFGVDTSVAGLAVISELPQRIDDAYTDERTSPFRDSLKLRHPNVLAVPIRSGNDITGVLNFESDRAFNEEDELLVLFLSSYASFAMEREKQANRLAELTGEQKQSALAAQIIHTMGNPIRTMQGWLNSISRADRDSLEQQFPDIGQAIEEIGGNIQQLLKVVGQVRSILDRSNLISKVIDVNESISSALKEWQSEPKDIQIYIQLHSSSAMILADDNLQGIFLELLENSRRSMPSGGEIRIQVLSQRDSVVIQFTDTGDGIPASQLPHIFDHRFSTKDRPTSSDGLGLFWCRRYIDSIGGNISADSEVGKGTTITIALPHAMSIKAQAF